MKLRILFLALFLGACMKSEKQNSPKNYFDIPSLIDQQIAYLSSQKPVFLKKASFSQESSQQESSQIDWQKEFKAFKDCDLNLPVLKDSYQVSENDTANMYQTQDPKATVKSLVVKGKNQPEAIYLHWVSENAFYKTEKWLSMHFKDQKVVRYEVKGYQKLIFKDSLLFQIQAVAK